MSFVGAPRLKKLEPLTGSSDTVMQYGFHVGYVSADDVWKGYSQNCLQQGSAFRHSLGVQLLDRFSRYRGSFAGAKRPRCDVDH